MTDIDLKPFQRLALVAAQQGGCFSRRQALAAGLTRGRVERALADREWARVHPGVYVWAGTPIDSVVRSWAAIVACQDGPADGTARRSAMSHRSAAGLIGNHVFKTDGLTEVTVSGVARPRLPRVQMHRSRDLSSTWITTKFGPPCTTPARTLVDLSAVVTDRLLRKVMEEWLADRKVTVEALRLAIAEHRGRGRIGASTLAEQLELRTLGDEIADSDLEAELGDILARYGLPLPRHHFVVDANGRVVAELDWAFPDSMVALEVYGYGVHLRSRTRWERDMDRHNEVTTLGWAVLHYSKRQMRHTPRKLAEEVRTNLLERAERARPSAH